MPEDEFELMSHDEIAKLKEQLAKLKKKKKSASLKDSIDALNANIESLVDVFEEASREVRTEDFELMKKIGRVLEQNQKIAQGIVKIAEMLEGKGAMPPMARTMPPPPMPPPPSRPREFDTLQRMPFPPPGMPPLPPERPTAPPPAFGPLPPLPPRRRGMFER